MPGRINGLDGIRALAVLFVYVQHSNELAAKFSLGKIGVWAFFVLSGFLIIRILYAARARIEAGTATFAAEFRTFLGHRTARIFPIYYLVLAVASVLAISGHQVEFFTPDWATSYWTYLTNIKILYENKNPGIFAHLWSLAIEEQFYVFAAPVFLLLPRRYAISALILIIAGGLIRKFLIDDPHGVDTLANSYMLALGGLTGLLVDRVGKTLARAVFFACTVLLFGAFATEVLISAQDRTVLLFVPIYMAITYVYIFRHQGSLLVTLLSVKPLLYLGGISYGFYLPQLRSPSHCVRCCWCSPRRLKQTQGGDRIRRHADYCICVLAPH